MLPSTKHNGFPIINNTFKDGKDDHRQSMFCGLVLRSHLLVLLKNKQFKKSRELGNIIICHKFMDLCHQQNSPNWNLRRGWKSTIFNWTLVRRKGFWICIQSQILHPIEWWKPCHLPKLTLCFNNLVHAIFVLCQNLQRDTYKCWVFGLILIWHDIKRLWVSNLKFVI